MPEQSSVKIEATCTLQVFRKCEACGAANPKGLNNCPACGKEMPVSGTYHADAETTFAIPLAARFMIWVGSLLRRLARSLTA